MLRARRSVVLRIGIGSGALLLSPLSFAKSNDPIRIEYSAVETCPSSDAFEAQLASRAPHARFAERGGRARVLLARVESRGAHFHGSLVVREIDGSEEVRVVDGSTCREVVTGLALVAALAVEPSASDADADASASTSAANANDASSTTAANKDGPPTDPSTTKSASKTDPKSSAAKSENKEPTDPDDHDHAGAPKSSSPHAIEISLGIDAGVVGGASPVLLGTLPVFFEIARGGEHGFFSPSIRFRFERPGEDADPSSIGSAHFTWTEGSVDLCPIAWSPFARLRLVPCLRGELGILDASGVDASPSRSESRPWFSLGAAGRLRVAIVGPFFAEIEGEIFTPLVRDRFYLEPNTTIFRASAVAWSGAAGLGVSIW